MKVEGADTQERNNGCEKRRKDENLEFLFGVGRALSQNRIQFPFLHLDSALFFFTYALSNCGFNHLLLYLA